jgi:hypothetical protein
MAQAQLAAGLAVKIQAAAAASAVPAGAAARAAQSVSICDRKSIRTQYRKHSFHRPR